MRPGGPVSAGSKNRAERDYIMTPETEYTIQLAIESDVATGLIAPTCQMPNGETYVGGMKLSFQRP